MKIYIKHSLAYVLTTAVLLTPTVSFAALSGTRALLSSFGGLLNLLVKVIFGLALVFFFWGTAQFILNSGEQKTRDEGKQKMIWGIVALFVMISIYGIIAYVGNLIGIPVGVNGSTIQRETTTGTGSGSAPYPTPCENLSDPSGVC